MPEEIVIKRRTLMGALFVLLGFGLFVVREGWPLSEPVRTS